MFVRLDGWWDGWLFGRIQGLLHPARPKVFIYRLMCTRCIRCRCIMHKCVISTMFGSCFWFLKKTFFFKQPLVPPLPRSFAFSTSIFYPVDPPWTDGQRDDRNGWQDRRVQGLLHFSSPKVFIYRLKKYKKKIVNGIVKTPKKSFLKNCQS
jgi:hypothetical protein